MGCSGLVQEHVKFRSTRRCLLTFVSQASSRLKSRRVGGVIDRLVVGARHGVRLCRRGALLQLLCSFDRHRLSNVSLDAHPEDMHRRADSEDFTSLSAFVGFSAIVKVFSPCPVDAALYKVVRVDVVHVDSAHLGERLDVDPLDTVITGKVGVWIASECGVEAFRFSDVVHPDWRAMSCSYEETLPLKGIDGYPGFCRCGSHCESCTRVCVFENSGRIG